MHSIAAYRIPTNFERCLLTDHEKKAEILTLRQFFYCVLETLGLGQWKKMKWKTLENLLARKWESHNIHVAAQWESRDY